jgi:hypothetical protein
MASSKIMDISLANSLSKFHGKSDENLDFFLQQIEDVASLEKWSESKKFLILKLNLKDDALKFVANDPVASKATSFPILKNLLRKKFIKTKSFAEVQHTFSNISHKPGQSVKQLAEEISQAAEQFMGIDENATQEMTTLCEKFKLNKLIEVVRSDIKFELKKSNPKKFNSAIQYACNIENALADCEYNVNNNTLSNEFNMLVNSQMLTNQKIEELSQKLQELTINKPQDVKENKREEDQKPRCLICDKAHLTINCWHFPAFKNLKNDREGQENRENKRYRPYENRGNWGRNNRPSRGYGFNRVHPFRSDLNS